MSRASEDGFSPSLGKRGVRHTILARTMNASKAKNTDREFHASVLVEADKLPSRREDLQSVRFESFPGMRG